MLRGVGCFKNYKLRMLHALPHYFEGEKVSILFFLMQDETNILQFENSENNCASRDFGTTQKPSVL